MANSTHRVEVVPVKLLPHPNADSLSLVEVFGYRVVVRTAEWASLPIGAYVPPDSVVPDTEEWKWVHNCEVGAAPVSKRRIKARKFRGEWSQGLLVPAPEGAKEGDDVAAALGITHYEPPESPITRASAERIMVRRFPKTFRGWIWFVLKWPLQKCGFLPSQGYREQGPDELYPKYDVDTWYRYKELLTEGERVVITEKIHGSNARYVFEGGRMYCGSRTEWKRQGPNIWWQVLEAQPWIEQFCRANPGVALYGEVTPTQEMAYGGSKQFFCFDVRKDGKWVSWRDLEDFFNNWPDLWHHWVPVLYEGPYVEGIVLARRSGKSTVEGAAHIREGVVIRPWDERTHPSIGRVQLKAVSPEYLEKA